MQTGRWIFVTAGDGGIGAGIVKRLAGEGYKVIFTYRSHKERALLLADNLNNAGGNCSCYYCDIRDHQGVTALCHDLITMYGAPYGIVNNAGIKKDKLLINTTIDEWRDVTDTNINGTFYVIRMFLPSMITAGKGCIITISSISALRGNIGQTAYSSSKAAQGGLTQSLAREVGMFNIRVNNIAPGLIATDMLSTLDQKTLNALLKQTALRKQGQTDNVAKTVSFLLGEGGDFITGQTVVLDGGLSV